MAMYIPYLVESPYQSPIPTFSPPSNSDCSNQVSEFRDATAHRLAPCIRKRPISFFEDITHDLCTTRNFNSLTSVKDASHTANFVGSQVAGVMPPTKRRRRSSGKIPSLFFCGINVDVISVPVARYGTYHTNIFLRMQNTDIPKEEEDPYLLIPARLPAPDDFLLDMNDQRYLQMFLEKGRAMIRPLAFFFPTACERMFKTSLDHTRLRHAIIAIAMHYSDRTSTLHCANPRLDQYLEVFSPDSGALVRPDSIGQEGEIFALFLVLTITLVRLSETKDVETLRRHVKRLYKLFRNAQAEVSCGKREKLSPLLFSIWRQVMRINVTFALGVTHNPAVFPPPASHPGGHPAEGHGPVRQYLGSASRELEDWTLAQLELDDWEIEFSDYIFVQVQFEVQNNIMT